MEIAISAAHMVVAKALGPVSDGLLESWTASSELGPNVRALKLELLYAQGMLDSALGRDVCDRYARNPALGQLLLELRHQAYSADDVLDELEYFRVQDELEGTYETTDADGRGLVGGLLLNARHTARAIVRKLKLPSCSCASVCQHHKKPKIKFDRVALSKQMVEIVEQLKPICAKVSTILDLELQGTIASNSTTSATQGTGHTRNTSPQIIEPKLYGRDKLKKYAIYDITHGKYGSNKLTVLSIVGPGGLGKTTLTQHVYQDQDVKSHFQVMVWICVSQNFSANRLAQEIVQKIPKADNENGNESAEDLIEKRLQSKLFLFVLDDMWTDHEDDWKKLLAPFEKGQTKGSMVVVTTRIPKVAQMVTTKGCPIIRLGRLSDEECMCLFKACVFDGKQTWEVHKKLHDVGEEIVKRLKGFPLAVKTVSRILKVELTPNHWTRVLESKEWEHQVGDDDIMPALKLSYNFLPFHLQQCFSHCALFPEDYEFCGEELIHLWIGLGLLIPNAQNKRIEDIGLGYLRDLVSHSFFQQEDKKEDGQIYYVIHDLLHDMAKNVSAYECISIQGSNVWSVQIPTSIRHMSFIIENADVQDRTTFEKCKKGLDALGKRLKATNLCTLMLFGDDHWSFCKLFGDMFQEAASLRVIFLSGAYCYDAEDLLHNLIKNAPCSLLNVK